MRNIRILNKNYEDVGLFTPISALNGYTLNDVFNLEVPVPFLSPEQYDYWEDVYNNIKSGIVEPNLKYKDYGKSIQDIAWVNQWTKKNLARPNLDGKQYLGDGVYRLYDDNGITVDYDVYNGIWTINGLYNGTSAMNVSFSNENYRGIVTAQMIIIDGFVNEQAGNSNWRFASDLGNSTRINFNGSNGGYVKTANKTDHSNILLRFLVDSEFINFQFKLQLEQGDIATEYELPYIEGYSKTTFRYSDLFDNGLIKGNNENLAVPDLTGKEYLGDGEYFLENVRDKDIIYNVYNGDILISGFQHSLLGFYNLFTLTSSNSNAYTLSINTSDVMRIRVIVNGVVLKTTQNIFSTYQETFNFNENDIVNFELVLLNNYTYDDVVVKLQLEQGTTATPYTVPASTELYKSVNEQHTIPYMEHWEGVDALVPQPSIEQLNKMFSFYMANRHTRVLPSVYLPIEPVGFGNRYKFKELNNKIYDHELDFENMELSMLFGVHSNAYASYKSMQDFVKNNELVIEYDYGLGKRYTDVRLINAPKTEKETNKLIVSRFSFKRLTPFYELLDESDLPITNDTGLDMGIIIKCGEYNDGLIWFRAEIDGINNRVTFGNPQRLNFELYDSLDKKMIFNGENVGYGMIQWTNTDEPFIVIKPNQVLGNVVVPYDGETKIIIKKWISD